MAANNPVIIISFKTAHEVFKKLDLAKKRQVNYGTNDFEIVEDILHHERVELINFSDQNLDPERLVSSVVKGTFFMVLNFEWLELNWRRLWLHSLSLKRPQIGRVYGSK